MSFFINCALTVLIETPFMRCFGYRGLSDTLIIVCTNIVSNLLLNLALVAAFPEGSAVAAVVAEAIVVAAEYAVYAVAFGRGWKLFLLTFAANALSCGLGLAINACVR